MIGTTYQLAPYRTMAAQPATPPLAAPPATPAPAEDVADIQKRIASLEAQAASKKSKANMLFLIGGVFGGLCALVAGPIGLMAAVPCVIPGGLLYLGAMGHSSEAKSLRETYQLP